MVLIIDGAAGHPLPQRGGKTSLELARTPHLDALAAEGQVGLTCTVPEGMEPSSAIACMSIMGYDPRVYYKGRSAIEALSMGINIGPGRNGLSLQSGRRQRRQDVGLQRRAYHYRGSQRADRGSGQKIWGMPAPIFIPVSATGIF